MLALTNGRIWTGEGFARTVLIEGNRVVALDASVPHDAQHIDLRGRLAVPGFIDNHVHFILGGLQLARVSLRDAHSPEELRRRIEAQAARVPDDGWVLGTGWDEQLWSPPVLPTRQLVDGIEKPLFVTRLDIHMGLANTAALRLAGITRDTADPSGGTIVRDAYGEPTGVLKDAAMAFVTSIIPPPSIDERIEAARAALQLAASLGVTAFCDMGMTLEAFDDFRAYQRLDRQGALTARIAMYAPIGAYERLKAAGVEKRFGGERLRIGGLKGFADGSLGSSTAAFFQPFDDDACNCGLLMAEMSDGRISRWTEDADAHELQVTIHAIGDRANADVLSLFESRPNVRERRFRIEHAQHLDPHLIERFAKSGVIASMQPYHAADDGRWAETRVGAHRARYAFPWRSLIDAGAIVTFGSDWSVAPLDPLLGIRAAVAREWVPEQRVTVEEALRCYTVNNAYAMFAENEIGRIAPGMLADIVVLSHDLFESVEGARVDTTIFDGRVIFTR